MCLIPFVFVRSSYLTVKIDTSAFWYCEHPTNKNGRKRRYFTSFSLLPLASASLLASASAVYMVLTAYYTSLFNIGAFVSSPILLSSLA